jgi:hypothetical protein
VEKAIREAQERGEFDNLPGAGKPLHSLGNPEVEDPDWWVKRLVERENLDMSGAMSPSMALRKESAGFPESLLDLRTEESVRVVLEDFNRRVKQDRLRPGVGNLPPLLARTVDVDDLAAQWHAVRAATTDSAASEPTAAPAGAAPARARGSWVRRLLRRS